MISSAVSPVGNQRLLSLDAFRGLVILGMISGGFRNISQQPGALLGFLQDQMTHSVWIGVTFYDVIFPAFLFIVGVSLPFSYAKAVKAGKTATQRLGHVAWRAVLLFLLGSLRVSVSAQEPTWFELSSALQPIAVAYLAASVLLRYSIATRAIVAGGIVALYWLVLALVSGTGIPAGTLEMNHNLVWTVDHSMLGRAHADGWGTMLLFFPQIAHTLCGTIAGEWLRERRPTGDLLLRLGGGSVLCIAGGLLCHTLIPSIMKLWTPSYILITVGCSGAMLLLFHWTIDLRGHRDWAFPFIVFGMNAIALYIGNSLFGGRLASIVQVFTKDIIVLLGGAGPAFNFFSLLFVKWLILFWMYRRRIFLKV